MDFRNKDDYCYNQPAHELAFYRTTLVVLDAFNRVVWGTSLVVLDAFNRVVWGTSLIVLDAFNHVV